MADIYIFGDIVSTMQYFEDTSAGSFVYDLSTLGGEDVTVHINSGGGDVFAALAIYNALKNYSGGVTISIEGLAASAASLIAMARRPVTMAANALMMLHPPSVMLAGYFNAAELDKLQAQLTKIEESIIATYGTRVDTAEARRLLQAETWLNAEQALDAGLIDEITAAVDVRIDDARQMLFVNKLAVSTKKFDATKMRRAMEANIMDEKTFAAKQAAVIAEVRQQEISRIRDLQGLKCDNAAVNAILDAAISNGSTVAQVQEYVDAVKAIPSQTAQDATDKIVALIRDQLTSGAEGVVGSQPDVAAEDKVKAQSKLIADFANGMV